VELSELWGIRQCAMADDQRESALMWFLPVTLPKLNSFETGGDGARRRHHRLLIPGSLLKALRESNQFETPALRSGCGFSDKVVMSRRGG